MKPIKEGCLAFIIHTFSVNSGVVTVGKFIGKIPGCYGDDYWEVDRPMFSHDGKVRFHNQEVNLMRIDGEFEDEQQQTNKVDKHEQD